MDPATIVQIVGTVLSLGDVVVRCIAGLSALKAQFHDAPIIVTSMIGQLYMVKIAQDQLSPLNSPNLGHSPRYCQLAEEIGNALGSFDPILLALSQQLDRHGVIGTDQMTAKRRMIFLQDEKEMTNLSILLDRQVNALNLLLQAIQCQTWVEQSQVITEKESQLILQLAKDCSSSLVALGDVASFISETTGGISVAFEFDAVLRSTSLYQDAERSHLKQAIRAGKVRKFDNVSVSDTVGRRATFKLGRAFRAIKLSGPIAGSNKLLTHEGTEFHTYRDTAVEFPNNSVLEEEFRSRERSHHSSSSDAESTSSGMRIPLRSIDSNTPQPQTGFSISQKLSIESNRNTSHRLTKVLLLGASGGGKSTLLHALQLFTGHGDVRNDKYHSSDLVWDNVINSTRTILRAVEELVIDPELTARAHVLFGPQFDWDVHSDEVARLISSISFQTAFHEATKRRKSYQFHDNGQYYIDHIHRLAEQRGKNIIPTNRDFLRAQATTTGIHQSILTYHGSRFLFHDVGGERCERRKWKFVCQDVSTVIYPVDTTAYGRVLRSDPDSERMQEQFVVFEEIANNEWFAQSNFIIVFTKTDLLMEYLKECDVSEFMCENEILHVFEPQVAMAYDFMNRLEGHFRKLIRSRGIQKRTRFVRANLVDVDKFNPASDIFDALESFDLPREAATPNVGPDTPV